MESDDDDGLKQLASSMPRAASRRDSSKATSITDGYPRGFRPSAGTAPQIGQCSVLRPMAATQTPGSGIARAETHIRAFHGGHRAARFVKSCRHPHCIGDGHTGQWRIGASWGTLDVQMQRRRKLFEGRSALTCRSARYLQEERARYIRVLATMRGGGGLGTKPASVNRARLCPGCSRPIYPDRPAPSR